MDRSVFYKAIRPTTGALKQPMVDGFELSLDIAESLNVQLDYTAYILATFWWETGRTMQPVKEAYWLSEAWRKKNLRYFPYYGRGPVQITWEANYRRATEIWNTKYRKEGEPLVDFVKNPDLMLEARYSFPIAFNGMLDGWFTGKALSDYLDGVDEDDKEDLREFANARRVVNGIDKQIEIGKLALVFEKALRAAGYGVSDYVTVTIPRAVWEAFVKWANEE